MALEETTAARLRAIIRELANKNSGTKSKGERIDIAVRRLELLAEDFDAGVEGDKA